MTNVTSRDLFTSDVRRAEAIAEGLLLGAVCVVSVLANVSLWLVVLTTRRLRNESNILILCLSLADLLVSAVSMPITVATIGASRWPFTRETCVAIGYINMLTFTASVQSLAVISVNRYVKICRPSWFVDIYTFRNVFLMCVGVWIFSGLLSVPPLLGWGAYSYLPTASVCFCDWSVSFTYALFMIFICFCVPCLVMCLCNVGILRAYFQSRRALLAFGDKRPSGGSSGPSESGTPSWVEPSKHTPIVYAPSKHTPIVYVLPKQTPTVYAPSKQTPIVYVLPKQRPTVYAPSKQTLNVYSVAQQKPGVYQPDQQVLSLPNNFEPLSLKDFPSNGKGKAPCHEAVSVVLNANGQLISVLGSDTSNGANNKTSVIKLHQKRDNECKKILSASNPNDKIINNCEVNEEEIFLVPEGENKCGRDVHVCTVSSSSIENFPSTEDNTRDFVSKTDTRVDSKNVRAPLGMPRYLNSAISREMSLAEFTVSDDWEIRATGINTAQSHENSNAGTAYAFNALSNSVASSNYQTLINCTHNASLPLHVAVPESTTGTTSKCMASVSGLDEKTTAVVRGGHTHTVVGRVTYASGIREKRMSGIRIDGRTVVSPPSGCLFKHSSMKTRGIERKRERASAYLGARKSKTVHFASRLKAGLKLFTIFETPEPVNALPSKEDGPPVHSRDRLGINLYEKGKVEKIAGDENFTLKSGKGIRAKKSMDNRCLGKESMPKGLRGYFNRKVSPEGRIRWLSNRINRFTTNRICPTGNKKLGNELTNTNDYLEPCAASIERLNNHSHNTAPRVNKVYSKSSSSGKLLGGEHLSDTFNSKDVSVKHHSSGPQKFKRVACSNFESRSSDNLLCQELAIHNGEDETTTSPPPRRPASSIQSNMTRGQDTPSGDKKSPSHIVAPLVVTLATSDLREACIQTSLAVDAGISASSSESSSTHHRMPIPGPRGDLAVHPNVRETLHPRQIPPVAGRSSRGGSERRRREEFQLSASLLVVIVIFVISWFPYCVSMFVSVFSPELSSRRLDVTSLFLGYSNSCVNPIVYGVMNKKFQTAYRGMLSSCLRPLKARGGFVLKGANNQPRPSRNVVSVIAA